MATYLLFGKYTSGVVKGISTSRTKKAVKLINKHRGEVNATYALLGEKDLLFVTTFPDAEQAMSASAELSRLNEISFTMEQGVAVEEFDNILADI